MYILNVKAYLTGARSTVDNMSDCRCKSRSREFDSTSVPFMEIDHEIISTSILLSSAASRRAVVSYKRKYVHEALVNLLVKLVQERSVVR